MIFEDGLIKTPYLKFDEACGGVGCIFYNHLKEYSDRIALINSCNDEYLTYQQLLERSISTAIVLQKRGIKQQDVIGICSNRETLDASVPIIAGQFLGSITFNIDPNLTLDETIELIRQVQPKIIFVIDNAKQLIAEASKNCNIEAEIIIFGNEFENEFLKIQKIQDFRPTFIENFKETSMIHFSSGSSGIPKAICLSYYYIMEAVSLVPRSNIETTKLYFSNHDIGGVSLSSTQWHWVSSTMEMLGSIYNGKCRILQDSFDVGKIWNIIEKYKVTDIFLRPVDCIALTESQIPKNLDISSLKIIVIGGSQLHKDYIERLREILPGVSVMSFYAMTECGLITFPFNKQFLKDKPESCGLPVPGLYYKVIDLETGKLCGPNQKGELLLKGRRLFNGFHNQDCSESFDDEGYFKTGDLVYFDEDFCFYFVDRLKALVKWKNIPIYPSQIEKVLLGHPAVSNAMVIGIPHRTEIERLMGVVILKDNADSVTEEDLVKFVEDRVEDHKRLREGLVFVKHFPSTVTGKPIRLKVKEMILSKVKASEEF